MSFDFMQRLFDMFNFSNQTYKNILVFSLSVFVAIVIVVFAKGKDKGVMENKIVTIENNIVDIKKKQTTTHNDVLKNRLINKAEISKLYNELLEVQNLDKEVMDDKINMLLDYSVKNIKDKKRLENIFNILDDIREADVARLHSDTKQELRTDTTKMN